MNQEERTPGAAGSRQVGPPGRRVPKNGAMQNRRMKKFPILAASSEPETGLCCRGCSVMRTNNPLWGRIPLGPGFLSSATEIIPTDPSAGPVTVFRPSGSCLHQSRLTNGLRPLLGKGPKRFRLVFGAPISAVSLLLRSIPDLKNFQLSLSPPSFNIQLQGHCPNLPLLVS